MFVISDGALTLTKEPAAAHLAQSLQFGCRFTRWTACCPHLGLADPTLAQAVADLNSSSDKSLPRLGYAGFTWDNFINTGAGKIVEANVRWGARRLGVAGERSRLRAGVL
jgi:hypothetical protein